MVKIKEEVSQPINETWQANYHSITGLNEEDFVTMNNTTIEDLPPQEREVLIDIKQQQFTRN